MKLPCSFLTLLRKLPHLALCSVLLDAPRGSHTGMVHWLTEHKSNSAAAPSPPWKSVWPAPILKLLRKSFPESTNSSLKSPLFFFNCSARPLITVPSSFKDNPVYGYEWVFCLSVCLCVCMYAHVWSVPKVVSHLVGTWKQTWVLCKSSKRSYACDSSHLSASQKSLLNCIENSSWNMLSSFQLAASFYAQCPPSYLTLPLGPGVISWLKEMQPRDAVQ